MSILIYGTGRSGGTALFHGLSRKFPGLRAEFEKSGVPGGCLLKIGVDDLASIPVLMDYEFRIWLCRDPRDRVVSAFLHALGLHWAWDSDPAVLDLIADLLLSKSSDPEKLPFLRLWSTIGSLLPVLPEPVWKEDVRAAGLFDLFGHQFHSFRYEDLMAGNLDGLRRYLPFDGPLDLAMPPVHYHVRRTARVGEWACWLAESDLEMLKPNLEAPMAIFGYRWADRPDPVPVLDAASLVRYFINLVNRRRRNEGMDLWVSSVLRT